MSKRQEIREQRRREQLRNRIITIALVVVGALFVTFALILPSVNNARLATSATQTAENATPVPVLTIVPAVFNTKVNGQHLGDPNAPVKVDVYGDFRCSACKFFSEQVEPQIIKDYVETGKVYLTYRFFIVIDGGDGTDASLRSANAAMCAAEQNRFWDYDNTLYTNQVTESALLYTDERLTTMAENLSLDMTKFNSCYQAKKYAGDVQADINQGLSLQIRGTPSVFVNNKLVPDFQQTSQAIDTALAGK
jgi:protein-disulfide isomerase